MTFLCGQDIFLYDQMMFYVVKITFYIIQIFLGGYAGADPENNLTGFQLTLIYYCL